MSPKVSFSMRTLVHGLAGAAHSQYAEYDGNRRNSSAPCRILPYALTRPFLFGLDPEHAHELHAARAGTDPAHAAGPSRSPRPACATRCDWPDLAFRTAIGLAAGLDKNGRCIDAFGALGFGSSRSARSRRWPSAGNPKPRLFRLRAAQALINRLGFNNDGLAAFDRQRPAFALSRRRRHPRLQHRQERGDADRARRRRLPASPRRRLSARRLRDGQHLEPEHRAPARRCRATPRSMPLLAALQRTAAPSWRSSMRRTVPIFVKIAPDLEPHQVDDDRRHPESRMRSTA